MYKHKYGSQAMNRTIKTETLRQFYERTNQKIPSDLLNDHLDSGHFNVKLSSCAARKTPYNRRDYFKICLSNGLKEGKSVLRYNNEDIVLDGPCLIFTNPNVPSSIENSTCAITRYYCLFNSRFMEAFLRTDIQYSCALFNPLMPPVIRLSEEERSRLSVFFEEMISLMESDYAFKWETIRNLILILIHEGIRLGQSKFSQPLAGDRVVNGFFSLLNQQFPVEPENAPELLTPSAFADHLHVHVNHLNSVIKKHTGKTTRAIIRERVINEAKILLRNTDWNISEIAYALGFEYPSHFNKYFKVLTSMTPLEFRINADTLAV